MSSNKNVELQSEFETGVLFLNDKNVRADIGLSHDAIQVALFPLLHEMIRSVTLEMPLGYDLVN
jgi:hypothetical protein